MSVIETGDNRLSLSNRANDRRRGEAGRKLKTQWEEEAEDRLEGPSATFCCVLCFQALSYLRLITRAIPSAEIHFPQIAPGFAISLPTGLLSDVTVILRLLLITHLKLSEEGAWHVEPGALGRSPWQTVGKGGTRQRDWVGTLVGNRVSEKQSRGEMSKWPEGWNHGQINRTWQLTEWAEKEEKEWGEKTMLKGLVLLTNWENCGAGCKSKKKKKKKGSLNRLMKSSLQKL